MQIMPDTFKSFIRNKLSTEIVGSEILINRFTPMQYSAYENPTPRKVRAMCPSGACIDLVTDSGYIKFDYTVKGKARDWCYFDIYINGALVGSSGMKPAIEGLHTFSHSIGQHYAGKKRITIYLPHLVQITLSDMELEDDSCVEAAPPNNKLLLSIGDSITQGMDCLHPSSAYPVQLSRLLGMELLSQSVGGYVFNKDSLDENTTIKPDIITVAYGTNDWKSVSSGEQLSVNCSGFMEKLVSVFKSSKIFVLTPIWRADIDEPAPTGLTFTDVADIISNACSSFENVTVIDGRTLVPHQPEYYGDLRVHPNDIGSMHYTVNLAGKIIQKIF